MKKEQECYKAIESLYLELPSSIVDDVKRKVLDAIAEAKTSNGELFAIFDGGGQGMKDVGLMGVFDNEEKAKEGVGDSYAYIKKLIPNVVYKNGIDH